MEPVAPTPQSREPCPSWKTKTTIPNAAPSEKRLSTTALAARTTERNARVSKTSVSSRTSGEDDGEVAEESVQEVLVDGGDSGQRAHRAGQHRIGSVDDCPNAGSRTVNGGKGFNEGRGPLALYGRGAPTSPCTVRIFAAIRCGSPPFSNVVDGSHYTC